MLDVIFSVDTEIWCEGWDDIDRTFPDAFQRYVYGRTPGGDYGLPFQLRLLGEHGLRGVFFVESLFAGRFGIEPLREITQMIRNADQEVQLHLHTEWLGHALNPILPESSQTKRQYLRQFSYEEQTLLIAQAKAWLEAAGSGPVNAFRAGGFGFNQDTLPALKANGIRFDSSYNAAMSGLDSGVMPDTLLCEPVELDGVWEYPMTVYRDRPGNLRHAQLAACSFRELEGLLWRALEAQRRAVVILSHNFELLSRDQRRVDDTILRRFRQLCGFLDSHRDCFRSCGFNELTAVSVEPQPAPLSSPLWKTGLRMAEQLAGRMR